LPTDSRIVTREIRRYVWPELKARGFDHFTGRTAWRHSAAKIDVVNFQSFNSYLANGVGCTPHSFALNLGCYFPVIPSAGRGPIPDSRSGLLPQEFHCHIRLHLDKSIDQPELERPSVWLIGNDGRYLPEAIADATESILERGLPLLEKFADYEVLLDYLSNDDELLLESGTKGSPRRHYMIGYIALAIGKPGLAAPHFQAALDSGCYKSVEKVLRDHIRTVVQGSD
jgi:hypothetical protein